MGRRGRAKPSGLGAARPCVVIAKGATLDERDEWQDGGSERRASTPTWPRCALLDTKTGSAGPFLVGAVGFAAFLMAAGVLTLRCGVFARWTGIVALIGAVCFLITLLTVINNTGNGSVFGYAFFPALLALVTWTVATSIARYRAMAAMPAGAPA